jgi:hypothetical protein
MTTDPIRKIRRLIFIMSRELEAMPHFEMNGTCKRLIVNGEPLILLGGELHNSSSSSLEYLIPVWDKLARLNCNFVIATVSWELLEPTEGLFDFSLIDGIIAQAREHGLYLVLNWFGTWKNADSSYVPAWVKLDTKHFTRMCNADGKTSNTISCFSREARSADACAFAALMKHLREIDHETHTVVMIQVENETGFLGSDRDYSEESNELFKGKVPDQLADYLNEHHETLLPEVQKLWDEADQKHSTWEKTFGASAEEIFMAWNLASYVEDVARVGKAEYELPMYVNAWIKQCEGEPPGEYPSGGPVSQIFDIWKCAAPSIDLFSPDIYLFSFRETCKSYIRSNNPLFIPEARRDRWAAANLFYAIGSCNAVGFSPFGIDSVGFELEPAAGGIYKNDLTDMSDCSWIGNEISKSYKLIKDMMPVIAACYGTNRMAGVVQGSERIQYIELGGYRLKINFLNPIEQAALPGAGIIIAEDSEKFLIAGRNFSVEFMNCEGNTENIGLLSVDEGAFHKGKWVQGRRLNGDEVLLITMNDIATVNKIVLYRYQ